MPLRTTCSFCGVAYTLADGSRGKKVRCKKCQQVFEVLPSEDRDEPARPGGLQTEPRRRARPRSDEELSSPKMDVIGLSSAAKLWLIGGGAALVSGLVVGLIVYLSVSSKDKSAPAAQVAANGVPQLPLKAGPQPDLEVPVIKPKPEIDPDLPVDPRLAPPKPKRLPPERKQPDPVIANPLPPEVVGDPQPPPEPPFAGPFIVIDQPSHPHRDIKPPALTETTVRKSLPGAVTNVAVGGGGRYLILHIPSQSQLAIFDVNEASLVKTLPLADPKARFAAGMEHLVIASPAAKTLDRWSLATFKREQSVALKLQGELHALAMGSASNGPLLIASGDKGQFIHLANLEPFPLHWSRQQMPNIKSPFVRASTNGRLFCFRVDAGGEPHTDGVITLNGQEASYKEAWNVSAAVLLPSSDNQVLFSAYGMFTPDLKPIPFKDEDNAGKPVGLSSNPSFLPARHGPYFVQLNAPLFVRPGRRKAGGGGTLSFRVPGSNRSFARLEGIEGLTIENISYGQLRGTLCHDQRVHFIPAARLLITIPSTDDCLVLHRFDPDKALEESGNDYLFVTTQAPATVARGADFTYQIEVKSKKGDVKYRLLGGPEGLTVSPQGLVKWSVPTKLVESHTAVTVAITDSAGKEILHAFTILCHGGDEAAGKAKPQ